MQASAEPVGQTREPKDPLDRARTQKLHGHRRAVLHDFPLRQLQRANACSVGERKLSSVDLDDVSRLGESRDPACDLPLGRAVEFTVEKPRPRSR